MALAKRKADSKDFSRRRKLPLPRLVTLMICGMTSSVLHDLNRFFEGLYAVGEVAQATPVPSSFSRARRKLHEGVFGHLNTAVLDKWFSLVAQKLWFGHRLVAIDGTSLQFSVPEKSNRVKHVAEKFWKAVALYLPDHELTLHAQIYKGDVCERQILIENLDRLRPNDLLLLDRGYPSSWLMNCLDEASIKFVMRIDSTSYKPVKRFVKSGLADQTVTLSAPTKGQSELYECKREAPKVRLIRCVTQEGTIRVLATNLLDEKQYPTDSFHDLYHRRWRVEEAFKRQKHRLKMEAATGMSDQAVRQDFMAKILADNLGRIVAHRHDQEAFEKQKDRAVQLNTNRTEALRLMRTWLPHLLVTAWCSSKAEEVIQRITDTLTRIRRRVVEGRSYIRSHWIKPHQKSGYR